MKRQYPASLGELYDSVQRRWSGELHKARPDWDLLTRLHELLRELETALATKGKQ